MLVLAGVCVALAALLVSAHVISARKDREIADLRSRLDMQTSANVVMQERCKAADRMVAMWSEERVKLYEDLAPWSFENYTVSRALQ